MIIRLSTMQSYEPLALSSTGKANNMLISRCNFPEKYDNSKDVFMEADSDRLLSWDYDGFRAVLKRFGVTGETGIRQWLFQAADEEVMEFIKEALKAESAHPGVVWTGWCVTGTVHRGNGMSVYTLSLFANRSGVPVYSEMQGGNVEVLPESNCLCPG